ncbi:MAG: hypothetical protein NTU53_14845 [Planctomycetota bacterium]|nr:hypothetical protein [Planctomycetota bacterium]
MMRQRLAVVMLGLVVGLGTVARGAEKRPDEAGGVFDGTAGAGARGGADWKAGRVWVCEGGA